MAAYIQEFDVPEFKDLDNRLENEFNDIEIKKQHYAELIGMKKEDIEC